MSKELEMLISIAIGSLIITNIALTIAVICIAADIDTIARKK